MPQMAHGGAQNNGTSVDIINSININYIITHVSIGPAPAIPRLGIDPYQWGTVCDHGDVLSGPATSFPQSLGMVQAI